MSDSCRLHVPQGLDHLEQAAGVAQTAWRLGLFQAGEHPANVAQAVQAVGAHAHGHPFRGAKQIDQGRYFVTHWMFNQHCRPASTQHSVSERCHLQPRRYGLGDSLQLAAGFELAHEVAQVTVFHMLLGADNTIAKT